MKFRRLENLLLYLKHSVLTLKKTKKIILSENTREDNTNNTIRKDLDMLSLSFTIPKPNAVAIKQK